MVQRDGERQGDDVSKKKQAVPVEWVKGKDPQLCIACSKPFRAKDMIYRAGYVALHATRECVKTFKDDCDEIEKGNVRDGKA